MEKASAKCLVKDQLCSKIVHDITVSTDYSHPLLTFGSRLELRMSSRLIMTLSLDSC